MAISYSDYKKEWKNGIGKEIDKLKTEYAKQQQNSVNINNAVEDKKSHALATSTVVNPKIFELNTEKEKKEKAYQEYKNNLNNNVIFNLILLRRSCQKMRQNRQCHILECNRRTME